MSQVNFLEYKREFKEFLVVLNALQLWETKHPTKKIYDPVRIAHEQNLESAVPITYILNSLVEYGLFELEYHVRFPHEWPLSENSYKTPDDIPPTIYDSRGIEFEKEDTSVVPAYRRLG